MVMVVVIIVEARAPAVAPKAAAARLRLGASFNIGFFVLPLKRQAAILSVNRVNFALQHRPLTVRSPAVSL